MGGLAAAGWPFQCSACCTVNTQQLLMFMLIEVVSFEVVPRWTHRLGMGRLGAVHGLPSPLLGLRSDQRAQRVAVKWSRHAWFAQEVAS